MTTRRIVVLGLLLVIAAGLIGVPRSRRATAGAQCEVLSELSGSASGSAGSPTCYWVRVPDGSTVLGITLDPVGGGAFDLYHSEGQVTFLDEKVVGEEIEARRQVALFAPRPGTHTLGVVGKRGDSGFVLTATAPEPTGDLSREPQQICDPGAPTCRQSASLVAVRSGGQLELGPNFGDRITFPFQIGGPGLIEASVSWTGQSRGLALILNGPERPETPNPVGYYARVDGGSPLVLRYTVTAEDFRRGRKWQISLVNFSPGGGAVVGDLNITYPKPVAGDSIFREATAADFTGQWANVNPDTGGITRVEIKRSGETLEVHTWGACVPVDCDHGTTAVRYGGNPVVISRNFGFKREVLTLTLLQNLELRVHSRNEFTDGSRRDYAAEYRFRRVEVMATAFIPDACVEGYVWREARPEDHVCVTPETRDQTAYDNSQAGARRDPVDRTYGPDTCRQGYVWREAFPGDHVCVTPQTRAQAADDNRNAPNRVRR